jgi:hypothetical protein
MAQGRENLWKMTAIGVAVAAVTAVVTGVVVARRTTLTSDSVTARADQPPAASPRTSDDTAARPQPPAATAPASDAPARRVAQSGTPPQSVVDACNQQARAQSGAGRDKKGKLVEVGKDAGIGALGGAAVGAAGGAIASGGKGAGKGALIGGLVGAGGGTLYGIWDNKKHDEFFRDAYARCMKAKGYTA